VSLISCVCVCVCVCVCPNVCVCVCACMHAASQHFCIHRRNHTACIQPRRSNLYHTPPLAPLSPSDPSYSAPVVEAAPYTGTSPIRKRPPP